MSSAATDKFNGSPWRFLRDFLEAESDAREAAGFAEDHEYRQMARDAQEALQLLWDDSDKAIARIETLERLVTVIKALCVDLNKLANAGSAIHPNTWLVCFTLLKSAIDDCDVAAGRRTLTPREHVN